MRGLNRIAEVVNPSMPPDQVKRRPARGGAPNDLLTSKTTIRDGTSGIVETPRPVDPRNLVRDVRMLTLVDALYGDEPFGFLDDAGGVKFICPRCGHRDYNGGSARPIDSWSWHCWRCCWDGTRMHLEMLVLKSRPAVDRLFRLVNEGAK
jgi:hypothetical protein